MKKRIAFILSLLPVLAFAQQATITSPDHQVLVTIQADGSQVSYDVQYKGTLILEKNLLGLTINGRALPTKLKSKKLSSHHQILDPVVPIKFSHIEKDYNELILNMQGNYSIIWRAYNDGIAYRFQTRQIDEALVDEEIIELGVNPEYMLHIQPEDYFTTSYENAYSHVKSGDWKEGGKMSCLPLLIDARNCKILFSEADHYDYPRAFLQPGKKGLKGVFAKAWLKDKMEGDRHRVVTEEAPYIAKTSGARNYPWRYMVIAGKDEQLVENTMNACLSSTGCEIDDVSWIHPGQVSWDWWNGKCVYGQDVNFKSGINTETYKYFIDFASKYGIPYIILDEGWNTDVNHPFDVIPALDLKELIRYGEEKKVGLILWVTWYAVHTHPEIFREYSSWGVKGMKIDFMDRSDQTISNFYENTVKEAAKYRLVVDFHGAYTPAGLEYRYPNLLAYEGVRGMEQMGGCKPENSLYFPFMRNAVGAMDYTPGAMLSTQPEYFGLWSPNAMSIGTRAYQLALFITCETGTQMLADSPTQYYRNPECTEFITQVPVTWDETRALKAVSGEYLVLAKRKGSRWFLAGITNNTPRELEISLDFLNPGKAYTMTAFSDGMNASFQAMDYRCTKSQVSSSSTLKINMVRNGGFAAVLSDLQAVTTDAVQSMLNWRDPGTGVWETAGWWNSANVMTALLRYAAITGNKEVEQVAADVLQKAQHYKVGVDDQGNDRFCENFNNDYFDDQGWWALAWVEAYKLTKNQKYLNMAETIYGTMSQGWTQELGGGIYWKRNPLHYKNAIANNLYSLLSARLYKITKKEEYKNRFLEASDWMLNSGMINTANWQVEDGLDQDGKPNNGQYYTYNQGVALASLVERYELTQDRQYLDKAQQIADATLKLMTTSEGILKELKASTEPSGDGVQFKGVFVRHLAYLNLVEQKPEYTAFILRNAYSIAQNDFDPISKSFGCYWYGPFYQVQPAANACALDCMVEALAL